MDQRRGSSLAANFTPGKVEISPGVQMETGGVQKT
jgi:hypothetical protein